MNALNRILTSVFDVLLAPFELLGPVWSLILFSGVFGILALIVFKHISAQGAIRGVKDKIKGNMIAIRLFQDDLRVVLGSVVRVLLRNFQYLALNFGPFVPLAVPFVFVAAQFVVRYAYDPAKVEAHPELMLAGQGILLEVELADDAKQRILELSVTLPEGVVALSPLVRSQSEGRAFQEIAATEAGAHEIVLDLGGTRETKLLYAGARADAPRAMQPRRVSSRDWLAMLSPNHWTALWPAEPAFAEDSPFRSVAIAYPSRDLGWLPSGEGGILITFVLASMLFGFAALKPLGVTI